MSIENKRPSLPLIQSSPSIMEQSDDQDAVLNRPQQEAQLAFDGTNSPSPSYWQANFLRLRSPTPERSILLDFSNFQRLRLIGRGDVGTVYLVRSLSNGNLYAMKIMRKSDMIRRKKVQRVLSEREILATVSFPFILSFYGSFQDDEYLYLITDWCSGGEFYRLAQRQPERRFSESVVRFYSAEVLMALEYLHSIGVIYRDLKPENILLQSNGHIALSDFDLSRSFPIQTETTHVRPKKKVMFSIRRGFHREKSYDCLATGQSSFLEDAHSFVGTAEYLAPEVIQRQGHGVSVDWWCLGVLIFEWLTGYPPFGSQRRLGRKPLFENICRGEFEWPSHVRISSSAKDLVRRLLRLNAEERIGYEYGASEIMHHPFYDGINWDSLTKKKPPLRPAPADPSLLTPDPRLQGNCYNESITPMGSVGFLSSESATIDASSRVDPFVAFGCTVSRTTSARDLFHSPPILQQNHVRSVSAEFLTDPNGIQRL